MSGFEYEKKKGKTMSRKSFPIASLLTVVALALSAQTVFAHETVTVGDYDIEYGWVNEPVIVNQPNAIVINILSHMAMSGSVSLISPMDGSTVQGDQTEVSVMLDGLDASARNAGVHWHLFMDDKLLSMIPVQQTKVTVTGLTNGSHVLKVRLSDGKHVDFGEPATITINVSGASDTGTPAVIDAMALSMNHSGTHDHTAMSAAMVDVDVSDLIVEVSYGGQTRQLTLQPLGEDTSGQFIAPILPTVVGEYTIQLSGKIDGTEIQPIEVEPEEVQGVELLAFPVVAGNQRAGMRTSDLLAVAGFVFGLGGLVLGLMAYRKTR
jgi:hypothetical protein